MQHKAPLLLFLFSSACFSSNGLDDECTAVPECGMYQHEIEGCTDPSVCFEVSLCGETIFCEDDVMCGAVPVCDPSEVEVESCDGSSDCREVTVCGTTIHCAISGCLADPECDPGDLAVTADQCDASLDCYDRALCGRLIHCVPTLCEDAPPCFEFGEHLYMADICVEAEGLTCVESESRCGDPTVCTLVCARDGQEVLSGPTECADGNCHYYEIEGEAFWCSRAESECEAVPTCESWETELPMNAPCIDSGTCRYESRCGMTIQCFSMLAPG